MAMTNVVITGGAGFIASHVLDTLLNEAIFNIVVLDNFSYCASEKNVDSRVKQIENVDIRNLDKVRQLFSQHNIDSVVHLAAQSHVDHSFGNSLSFTDVNVTGTHVLLEAFRERWEQHGRPDGWRFVHISTDEVYGSTDDTHREDVSLLQPTNPYAASKAAAEMLVQSYYRSFKMPIVMTRSNNVYGPRQYPEKVIPKFILRLVNGQLPRLQGDGSQKRSFLYATDAANAIKQVFLKGQIGRVYNIGSSDEVSIVDLAAKLTRMICPQLAQGEAVFAHDVDRPFNDHRYQLDTSRIENELGWKQIVDFETGLQKTIDWYKAVDAKTYWKTIPKDIFCERDGDGEEDTAEANSPNNYAFRIRGFEKKDSNTQSKENAKEDQSSSCSSLPPTPTGKSTCAICIHLWNTKQLAEHESYVKNVVAAQPQTNTILSAVVLTVSNWSCSPAEQKSIEETMKKAAGVGTLISVLPIDNRGMDIGGFFVACGYLSSIEQGLISNVPKTQIDFILKLHTKSQERWRKRLTMPICGSVQVVRKSLAAFQQDSTVGQVGAKWAMLVDPFETTRPHLRDLCQLLTSKSAPGNSFFIGGTMFWYRWSLLRKLFQERARPCMLRKLLNDEKTVDYHWFNMTPPLRRIFGAPGASFRPAEQNVIEFERIPAETRKTVGSVLHSANTVPWEQRYREFHIEHDMERFFGVWVAMNGFKTVGF